LCCSIGAIQPKHKVLNYMYGLFYKILSKVCQLYLLNTYLLVYRHCKVQYCGIVGRFQCSVRSQAMRYPAAF